MVFKPWSWVFECKCMSGKGWEPNKGHLEPVANKIRRQPGECGTPEAKWGVLQVTRERWSD